MSCPGSSRQSEADRRHADVSGRSGRLFHRLSPCWKSTFLAAVRSCRISALLRLAYLPTLAMGVQPTLVSSSRKTQTPPTAAKAVDPKAVIQRSAFGVSKHAAECISQAFFEYILGVLIARPIHSFAPSDSPRIVCDIACMLCFA